MEIKFKRDTAFRKQFFVPDSFAHPAKMDAQLLIWLVERYTNVGETILDPMAGSGTTMLACMLGRDVVLVELEYKFCMMMWDNWEQVKMRPQLGYQMGNCQIIQGDARQLEGLLGGFCRIERIRQSEAFRNKALDATASSSTPQVDKIVTSPPYAIPKTAGGLNTKPPKYDHQKSRWQQSRRDPNKPSQVGAREGYGDSNGQIASLDYGNIDSIITSPPYEEAMGKKHHSPRADKLAQEKSHPVTYTDRVDSIITSPPYEDQIHKGTGQWKEKEGGYMTGVNIGRDYTKHQDNIGNLKSQSYLEAMLQVYQQCHKVLKPQGLMILVTKNFIRQKAVVRLDLDTIKLCEQAGFSFVERHYRKLPSQSFWRVIYHQKHPEVEQINYEDVLVFAK